MLHITVRFIFGQIMHHAGYASPLVERVEYSNLITLYHVVVVVVSVSFIVSSDTDLNLQIELKRWAAKTFFLKTFLIFSLFPAARSKKASNEPSPINI